jgi:hypothetical protein
MDLVMDLEMDLDWDLEMDLRPLLNGLPDLMPGNWNSKKWMPNSLLVKMP